MPKALNLPAYAVKIRAKRREALLGAPTNRPRPGDGREHAAAVMIPPWRPGNRSRGEESSPRQMLPRHRKRQASRIGASIERALGRGECPEAVREGHVVSAAFGARPFAPPKHRRAPALGRLAGMAEILRDLWRVAAVAARWRGSICQCKKRDERRILAAHLLRVKMADAEAHW